jgi:hypothetical protein
MRLRNTGIAIVFPLLLIACGSDGSIAGAPSTDAPALSAASDYPPRLVRACEAGARVWDGEVIAAVEDPEIEDGVICWADGFIPKAPPLGPNGEVAPPFDRVRFSAALDGSDVVLLSAGYRDQMAPPSP